MAPLICLWSHLYFYRPLPAGSKMVQDLFEKKSVPLFFYLLSFPPFPFRNSVKLYPAVLLNHTALYKLTVFPTPDFHSLFFSAVNLSAVSSFSNTGRIEVNPSVRQTCQGRSCADMCHGSSSAFSQQLCTCMHGLTETVGSIPKFTNSCESLGFFLTSGP